MATHSDHAHRWADRMAGRVKRDNYARGNSNVFADGDVIYSYGYHFEIARGIRDPKTRKVILILLNGDNFSSSTTQHQSTVRSAVAGTSLPSAVIPFSVLGEAGISLDTVRLVEVTADRHESWWEESYTQPKDDDYRWQMTERDGQTVWRIQRYRHWLGESLITGGVMHRALIKCPKCEGTGHGEPRSEVFAMGAEGPLDKRAERWHYTYFYDPEWEDDGREIPPRTVGATRITTQCERCGGSRRIETRRMRTAYFLSGFDRNEARPSYFFTELPPKVKPATIEEALDTLKPQAVRLAEQMGREVRRQGDIFAVPMPSLTLRQLRKEKGALVKMGSLFNTNHAASETFVTADGRTYIRGVLRHVPAGRRPDHVRVNVGKTWHMAIKNLTPISV